VNPAAFNVESTTKARAAIFTKGESPDQSPPWKSDTVSCLLTGHRREPHEGDMLLRPIAPSQSDWYVVLFHQPNYRGNPTNRLSVTTIRCQIHSHRETWLIGRERGVGLTEDDPTLFWWTIKGRKVISISRRTRSLSSAARRLIAVAQKARWAKWTREQKPA
jgi:hypothetical protein